MVAPQAGKPVEIHSNIPILAFKNATMKIAQVSYEKV